MIDTNYEYAQWSTNVNVSGMNWQTYHKGLWYSPYEKSYNDAIEEIKRMVWDKIFEDHPHLREPEQPKPNGKPEYGRSLAEQLNSCTQLKVLESYKFIVKGKPEQEIYDRKHSELSGKT